MTIDSFVYCKKVLNMFRLMSMILDVRSACAAGQLPAQLTEFLRTYLSVPDGGGCSRPGATQEKKQRAGRDTAAVAHPPAHTSS